MKTVALAVTGTVHHSKSTHTQMSREETTPGGLLAPVEPQTSLAFPDSNVG